MVKNTIILILIKFCVGALRESDRLELCNTLKCDLNSEETVCGIRREEGGYRLRIFRNECELMKYGCSTERGKEFGIINRYYCTVTHLKLTHENKSVINDTNPIKENDLIDSSVLLEQINDTSCTEFNCEVTLDDNEICGKTNDENDPIYRKFPNECYLEKYNCINNLDLIKTDDPQCAEHQINEDDYQAGDNETDTVIDYKINETKSDKENMPLKKYKNIIIVNGSMLDFSGNINDTIRNFFASTHYLKMPLERIHIDGELINETRRGRLLRSLAPVQIFQPWIQIPKKKSDDRWHKPTLSSCYHRCPEKCPETYAPVCGVPGVIAREPSLMFRNHCFMDLAQCKMFWEDKSPTAESSAYVESSFMFCLGDELNGLYRFLPLVRSLQHMGRLKRPGKFKYTIRTFRTFNKYLIREPKIMG